MMGLRCQNWSAGDECYILGALGTTLTTRGSPSELWTTVND